MPLQPGRPTPLLANDAGNTGEETREVEWQLAATDLGVIRRWLGQHSVLDQLSIEPLPAQQLHDSYLDTEDWRVFQAGFALRLREKEGQVEATLKGLHSARSDVADRREISELLPAGDLRTLAQAVGPVGTRVRSVAGVKPLQTLFELRTSRERYAVRDRASTEDVGEIALDETQFPLMHGASETTLKRVELEAARASTARTGPLERLAERLRIECGLQSATESKFAAGLRSAALAPPQGREREPVPPAMDTSTRAGDFAAAALDRLAGEWQAHEPAARLGESPEALHVLRVTGRRMDTVLSLFRGYIPAALGKSRQKLKSLLDVLGAVRDMDIRLEAAGKFWSSLPEGDRHTLDPLLRHLESERARARSRMLRALDAKRTRDWLETLPGQLARPTPSTASASPRDAAALSVVPDLIRGRYRKLRKCARRLSSESSMSEYHKVRVRTKKLRYALEVVAPTYAKPADEMLAALHRLQAKLGTQHDDDIVARYLTQLAAHPPAGFSSQTLFLMGRVAELHAREAARMGGKIEKPWRRVRGKRWKALRSRMKELREDALETGGENNGIDQGADADGQLARASEGPASPGASDT